MCNKGIKLGKKGSKLGKNGSKLGKNGSRLRPSCGFQHLLRNNVLAQLRNIKSFTFNIGTYSMSNLKVENDTQVGCYRRGTQLKESPTAQDSDGRFQH